MNKAGRTRARIALLLSVALLAASVVVGAEPAAATHGGSWHVTERASVSADGAEGNNHSGIPTISGDGRFVPFGSGATNLVPDDTNGTGDIFVRDRLAGSVERVSVDSSGQEGNRSSTDNQPRISRAGRFVAFVSQASNLVPSDANGDVSDAFLRDREAGTTELVSVGPGGVQTTERFDVQLWGMSSDGRYVLFDSLAPLVPEDTNGKNDMFLRDTVLDVTERVSVGTGGLEPNDNSGGGAVSADGRYVAFTSFATNLGGNPFREQRLYFRDRIADTTILLLPFMSPFGAEFAFAITDDGAEVLLTKSFEGLLVVNRETGSIERLDVASDGNPANGSVTGPGMSGDGRFVVFSSNATNLAAEDTDTEDVFVRDRQAGTTELVSISAEGVAGNGPSGGSSDLAISADGQHVAFTTGADNLVPGDTNGVLDVVVADRAAPPPPETGTITIVKNAIGGDETFSFTGSGEGVASSFEITTSGGSGSATFADLSPGLKTVTESGLPAGWVFTDLSCVDPDGGTTVAGQTASIDLDANETISCTVTNSALPPPPPPCPLTAVTVDTALSNDVVSGSVTGLSPCDTILAIHNRLGLWTNLRVTPIGGVAIEPAEEVDILYANNMILPPFGTVHYVATFTTLGQAVTAFVDISAETGIAAPLMNYTQAIVDAIAASGLLPGFSFGFKIGAEFLPDIVDAYNAMPHFRTAAQALLAGDFGTLILESTAAIEAGELRTMGSLLEKLSVEGAQELLNILSGRLGRAFQLVRIIIRDFGSVLALLLGRSAGSVAFVAS